MVHQHSTVHRLTTWQDEDRPSVANMVESIVGCKWSIHLLKSLANGIYRPSALLRACPGLSAKVMNERLRKMSRFGIIQRTVYGEKPPVEVEYHLTPFGKRFMTILDAVQQLQDAVDNGAIPLHEEMQREAANGRE